MNIHKVCEFTGHRGPVYALAYDHQNGLIYSGGSDGMVIRWVKDQDNPGEVLLKMNMATYSLHVDRPDLLLIAENQYGIRSYNPLNSALENQWEFGKYMYYSIVTNDDHIFVGDNTGSLYVGNKITLEWKKQKLGVHSIRSLSLSPEGHNLAAGLSDHTVRILDLESLEELYVLNAHDKSVFGLQYMHHKPWVLSGGKDAKIKIWATDKKFTGAGEIPAHLYGINYLDIRKDDKYFLTCSMDKTIKLWDSFSGELLKVVDFGRYGGHKTSVNKVLWTGENSFISAGDDGKVCVWTVEFD